jgi:parallel beta-helix repeat protein
MWCIAALALLAQPPVVDVTADNTEIRASCSLRIVNRAIRDADGNGVVHVIGDDITVDFAQDPLVGATGSRAPDAYTGVGVAVTGRNVTLTGLRVSGFKVAVHAREAPGLTIRDSDLSGNFRRHLASTPEAEDLGDWLSPHANDANEWMERYGAALYIEESSGVTIHDVHVRETQNGIVLDGVIDSRIFDNDCSFLSGWGLAMWRSSRNLVARNAFDFCIRGYSHGVYNRGQDSAGILLFEQCSQNVFAENSATHGGDGFFAFAGQEALGQASPRDDPQWYASRGNNENLIVANDFSDAAAHGIELTFSFDNRLIRNRLVGNAICGIWGGYSQRTLIAANEIRRNGAMGYGLERGGINIEHGCGNRILRNRFAGNRCGVHLWWDDDVDLLATPWAKANPCRCADNDLLGNTFDGDEVAVHLRRAGATRMANTMREVGTALDADEESRAAITAVEGTVLAGWTSPALALPGRKRPVGSRESLRGRHNIIMTEWGPWDHQTPLFRRISSDTARGRHVYELRADAIQHVAGKAEGGAAVRWIVDEKGRELVVAAPAAPGAYPYHLALTTARSTFEARGCIVRADWIVRVFPWTNDPREALEAWRAEANAPEAVTAGTTALNLAYGMKGPDDLDPFSGRAAHLPRDRFGAMAETRLPLPAGRWRIVTRSDDGIRVWLDGQIVIDDWTWHAPRTHEHEIEITEPRDVAIRVEHFELDGYAVLSLDIEPAH